MEAKTFRVLVTGSRTWQARRLIVATLGVYLEQYGASLVVVHGDCPRGADAIAKQWAREHGVVQDAHRAQWDTFGGSAGYKRNADMVKSGADVCLSFMRDWTNGTAHCTKLAEKAGIPTMRFQIDFDGDQG